jgi:uncharacterized protein YqhQ
VNQSRTCPRMRVGGMALGNGVLMRGPHYWALARADGTVVDGRLRTLLAKHRWLRVPVVRSIVGLAEMFGLALVVHRRNGVRGAAPLILWMALCIGVDFGLSFALPRLISNPVLGSVLLELLSLAFALLTLWWALGRSVWRYHGAEHKAVNAYEGGADLGDTDAVMTYSRVHDRCGTNLLVIVFLLVLIGYLPMEALALGTLLSALYSVLVVAVALELFRLVTRRPQSRVSRAVLAGGRALQSRLTTREPARAQVGVACAALGRVLELEGGAITPGAAGR